MIPAALIGPALKVLAVVVVLAGLFAAGEWHGRAAIQEQWDAAIMRQALQGQANSIRNMENTEKLRRELSQKIEAEKKRTRVVTREVKSYVESAAKKCEVSAEFVRVFDSVSGMRGGDPDGVSASTDSTGGNVDVSGTALTDVEVLRAYQNAVGEIRGLWEVYSALVKWTRESRAIAAEGAGR